MNQSTEQEQPAAGGTDDMAACPLDVLIVEDSEDDAILIAENLSGGGFDPHWKRVETAGEFSIALAERSWELSLADHRLPRFSAMGAFALYREAGLDIPFIIVSGMIGEDAAVAAMKAGVHDYLLKGKLARLAPAVRRELQEAEVRRNRAAAETALREAYSELSAIHSNAPVALLVVGEQLHVERANESGAKFTGRNASGALGVHFGEAVEIQCAPGCTDCVVKRIVVSTLQKGVEHRNVESRVPVWNGKEWEERWFLISSALLGSEGARRALICAQDITTLKETHVQIERQAAELEMRAQLIDLAHDAIIVSGVDRTIVGWNRGAEALYGWRAAETLGAPDPRLRAAAFQDAIKEIGAALERGGRWRGELTCLHRDGREVLTESRHLLVRKNVEQIGILQIEHDITDRRKAESCLQQTLLELEAALTEKTALLQEVHHRVKNNLAVIASLLSMKADASENAEARSALEESQERVRSMALIHEHLYNSEHLDRVNVRDYIQDLVNELRSAFNGRSGRIAMELAVEPIELEIERAMPLALILNELLTNSFKYAFPNNREGTVRVSFRKSEPGALELVVEDNGVGLPPGRLTEENGNSLGLRVVGILTRQLDGTLEQAAGPGTRLVFGFPENGAARRK